MLIVSDVVNTSQGSILDSMGSVVQNGSSRICSFFVRNEESNGLERSFTKWVMHSSTHLGSGVRSKRGVQ